MLRNLSIAILMFAATTWSAAAASAAPISPNNPYRSFNLSGVNYGSMKWERSQGKSRAKAIGGGSPRIFRRR